MGGGCGGFFFFFFSSRRRHTRLVSDWSSDVCSSDLCDAAMESADRWLVETANEVETAATEFVDRAPPEVRQVIDDAEQWLGEWGQAIDRSLDRKSVV